MQEPLMKFLFPAPKYTNDVNAPYELKYLECKERKIPYAVNEIKEAAHTLIYFHGNGYDISSAAYIMDHFNLTGSCNIICVEYPGYGYYRDTQTDFQIIEEDAVAVCTYAKKNYPQTKVIVIGRSMGSGPACFLASLNLPDAVLLISPFESLTQFVEDNKKYFDNLQLIGDQFNNLKRISEATIPIVIVHGQADKLISYEHSERLFKETKSLYKRISLPEQMTHGNIDDAWAINLQHPSKINEQQQMELNFIFFPKPEATYTELNLKNCQIGYVQGRAQRKIPFAYSSRPGARCLFLYFHGNAEDVGYANYMMREIQEDLGFPAEYACIEYPGYGIYTGISPTAELIEEDAEDVFKHFSEFQKPIIIIGRSMGSGPACYLASKYQAKGLILISAYESLEQLAKDKAGFLSYLVKQRFNNLERAVDIKMPTLLIHGKADPLIQYTHSETIHQRIKHNHKQLIVIEHMTHNDFHLGEDITKNIREFCLPLLIR